MVLLQFINIKKLRDLFSFVPKNILSYGVLKKCSRCSYQRSNEPVLIFSMNRGPRIILFHNEAYVRSQGCVGFEICGRCFEQSDINLETLPCRWNKI